MAAYPPGRRATSRQRCGWTRLVVFAPSPCPHPPAPSSGPGVPPGCCHRRRVSGCTPRFPRRVTTGNLQAASASPCRQACGSGEILACGSDRRGSGRRRHPRVCVAPVHRRPPRPRDRPGPWPATPARPPGRLRRCRRGFATAAGPNGPARPWPGPPRTRAPWPGVAVRRAPRPAPTGACVRRYRGGRRTPGPPWRWPPRLRPRLPG